MTDNVWFWAFVVSAAYGVALTVLFLMMVRAFSEAVELTALLARHAGSTRAGVMYSVGDSPVPLWDNDPDDDRWEDNGGVVSREKDGSVF